MNLNEIAKLSGIKITTPNKKVKIDEANAKSSDWQYVGADWKDMDGLVDNFKKALSKFGIYVYNDPVMEGSSDYGFILSKTKLTKAQVIEKLKEEGMYPEDED
jgi:hypothetical protein